MFEKGLALEGANKSVFTGLAILYAKYRPEKLMEHIKAYAAKLIMPKVMHGCEEARLWREAAVLYAESGEFDNAVRCMMDHGESAWDNAKFLEAVVQVCVCGEIAESFPWPDIFFANRTTRPVILS